jgi:aspartate aminotransferase
MQISESFRKIKLSQIVAVSEQARVIAPDFEKRTGQPFIYFQRGEVGYPTPKFLTDAFAEAFANGATKYPKSGGEAYFKDAVLADLSSEGITDLGHDNIVATYGGQEGLQLLLSMFQGSRVAGFTPCWSCMFDNLIPYTNCEFLSVPLDADNNWSINWDKFEIALQKCDIFYLNSPHNPTGRVFSPHEIFAIAVRCQFHGVFLICDEAYKELAYNSKHYSPLEAKVFENVAIVNTFSKSLAATGLRIGYIASRRKDLIERLTLGDYSQTAGVSTPTQYAISRALSHPDRKNWLTVFKKEMQDRANALGDNLGSFLPVFSPEGAFYLFLPTPEGVDENRFVTNLLERGVAVVPGSAFGTPGYFRLSFSTLSRELVADGAKRIGLAYSVLEPI